MQLEAVGRITMGDLGFKIGRQVDNVDGTEWAFLRTDTTTYAKALRDEGNLGIRGHLDTELACAHHRARLLAFLSTFLWFALVAVDNGNSGEFVRHDDALLPFRLSIGNRSVDATCSCNTGRTGAFM